MKAYSEEQYADVLMQLLPQGAAWPRDAESNLTALLKGLASEAARLDVTAHELLTELDAAQALVLLGDWEAMCGLPDGCSQVNETVAQRREAVVMRLSSRGGQSPEYFAELATLLTGELCTVEEFRPFRVGQSRTGDRLYNGAWPQTFAIHAPAVTVNNFRVGSSAVGEALRTWGRDRLECVIKQLKPAHTIVIFKY